MKNSHDLWLGKLRHLNPNLSRTKGDCAARYAPHKPLLLLALIDFAEAAGADFQPRVTLSVDLRIRFLEPWAVIATRWGSKPDIDLPFFHLSTQGFWKPLQNDGRPAQSPESTAVIELHPEFYAMLMSPASRAVARQVLVQTWFPPAEQIGLFAALGCEPDAKVVQSIGEGDAASGNHHWPECALPSPSRHPVPLHRRTHQLHPDHRHRCDDGGGRPHRQLRLHAEQRPAQWPSPHAKRALGLR